jgi:hypothetical protein
VAADDDISGPADGEQGPDPYEADERAAIQAEALEAEQRQQQRREAEGSDADLGQPFRTPFDAPSAQTTPDFDVDAYAAMVRQAWIDRAAKENGLDPAMPAKKLEAELRRRGAWPFED